MTQFISLSSKSLGEIRVNVEHIVAYHAHEYQWRKKPMEGTLLQMSDGSVFIVMETREEIDRLIDPTRTP